jgi:nicotinamidase-related amidase
MTSLDVGRSALLLMDFQPAILGGRPAAAPALARAVAALGLARRVNLQVVFVRVAFTPQDYGSVPDRNKIFAGIRERARSSDPAPETAQDVHPDLVRTDRDIVVTKTRVGAFSTTNLAQHLNARGIDTLILGGVSTSGVVLSTVRDAADRDYRLLVLADCCWDEPEVHDLLIERVFPRQADVIDVAGLDDRL